MPLSQQELNDAARKHANVKFAWGIIQGIYARRDAFQADVGVEQ